jgi:gluconokinase
MSATIHPTQAEPPLVLALDVGSSSLRAALFDRLGRAVQGIEARQPYQASYTADGGAEVDAAALLVLLFQCIDAALGQAGPMADRIAGVAGCSFVNNILGLDAAGRPATPITTYADTRSAAMVPGLRADFDEAETHQRTGCLFHPSYLPARLRWMAQARPDWLQRSARWVSLGEYLELQLFSQAAVSYSAAAWTGLLDRRRLCWDEPLLAGLPIDVGQLSSLVDVSTARRGLRPEFAARWPALAEVPWFPLVGDGAAANVGSGCVTPQRIALSMGTTTALRAVTGDADFVVPAGLWCYRVDGRRSLPGGALSEGGSVYGWLSDALRLGGPDEVEAALSQRPADGHGLTVLPFFAGERAPGWAGHARATIHGLSLATTPLDIMQAGLEAVAYRIALVYQRLRAVLPGKPQLVASGGALLGSPATLQIVADAIGLPVAASDVPETSARGAALLALEALEVSSIEEAPAFIGATVEPRPDWHQRYCIAIERQRELYTTLVGQD